MTVAELRKAMRGVSGNMQVYVRDHDHSWYEVNGAASEAIVVDQKNMDEHEIKQQQRHGSTKIKGKYFVVSV